ncbi:protein ALP1-like [Teleopsis dalmanni]|uniref:protein ALP1-like n=1 Tax=Teleopsis dalmanni TaxID=139649 RepID=UPI0018CD0195|nr:protein ALP1-like [Teleopsis dalmanni]
MRTFFSNICPDIIAWPSTSKKEEANINTCYFAGCLDGTRITIDPTGDRKDDYIDRKGNISLCLQAICDENRKFISIFVGHPGSCHDSWVLQNSPIYMRLPSKCGEYYLLADSAYPCTQHIITPYKDNGRLTRAQNNFNRKLGSGRILIENAFGILKQRFRQLLCHFIRVCCVLHYLANGNDLEFTFSEQSEEDNDVNNQIPFRSSIVRDSICNELQTQNNLD